MDRFSKEKRSYVMSRIKSKHTSIELLVRRKLWASGHRGYRIHPRKLIGNPDIVFNQKKVAIFLDGDFWHGLVLKTRAKKLPQYWLEKITRNVKRDRKYNRRLKELGWKVIRVWEYEILKDLDKVTARIVKVLG